MDYLVGDDFLEGLPLLIAGPMLRRTEPESVTVWVALKQPCTVRLKVLTTQDQGQQLGTAVLLGERHTVAVGQHLHVVAVTACPIEQQRLVCDRIYAYDLEFAAADQTYALTEALRSQRAPTVTVSYFTHEKPTFSLPPQRLDQLKIVHGSCRKPHGGGLDALPLLDCLIETNAGHPHERPHQLFLTGDQIYGDDVADSLQWVATTLGDTLLGWEEPLPVEHHTTLPPKQLPAGKRDTLATEQAGFTAGLNNKREKVTSHFLGFGEYCALYILERSPVCWPLGLPPGEKITAGRQAIHRWEKDRDNIQQFNHTLWKVRRALANVPTYTVFDDHDVSDDWNLNQEWCLRVLGRPLGRRAVQNALAAYGIFQAWGNTPDQFVADRPGAQLLNAVQRWSAAQGQDDEAVAAIATYLGLPPIDPATDLPKFIQDDDVWVLQRSANSITWHYQVYGPCHEVLALDTRTVRGYPVHEKPNAPPMLLSPSAFEQQISKPIRSSSTPYAPNDSAFATVVIASTNVISMKVLDQIQAWQLKKGKVFSADVGDSWNLNDKALAMLLTTLFEHRQTVVVLSGDIHYSSAVQLSYQDATSNQQSTLVQLVSSAIKNQELLTQVLHTRLKQWLLPEKPRRWFGWSTPPDMVEQSNYSRDLSHPPQWSCQTQWLQRHRARPVMVETDMFWLRQPQSRQWLKWLQFWRARWFQEGREAVGVNNIALVHFQNGTDSAQSVTILQDSYWFSTWLPTQIVRSRFQTPLDS
ncbi:MAG: alkaline phosphatase D family protein [Leptolyngbyaceae cyanobacterium]